MLILDAGDLLFKKFFSPIPENNIKMATQKAHLMVEAINAMGVDAMGIGDDDLSLGKEGLKEILKKAKFRILSSNLIDEESGKPLFERSLIKEVNGLRVGLFSLLFPESFYGQWDPRKKGLTIQPPTEAAQAIVKELQPKTDLIILLSHLSYPKDMELAQSGPGIHLIVGSHTGINLSYPMVVKNTIILQTAPKGMYGGKLDLTFDNKEPNFYNAATRRSLESNLNLMKQRLTSMSAPETEKAQWQKAKEEIERSLNQLQGKNEFTNSIVPLNEGINDRPDIGKMVEAFKADFPEPGKPPSPK
jgi:2',3'-cyclic-nucleotide 2'-phosphodiesterase (5'-nucleotidase family)